MTVFRPSIRTGPGLRGFRVERGVPVRSIRQRLALSDSRIRQVEREARPRREFVDKYIDAVLALSPWDDAERPIEVVHS